MNGGFLGLGVGTDEDAIYNAIESCKTPAERQQMMAAYQQQTGRDLSHDMAGEMGGADLDVATSLVRGDKAGAAAARMAVAADGMGTDENAIFNQLEGKTPEERQAIIADYNQRYGQTTGGRDFGDMVNDEMGAMDSERARQLAVNGRLDPAFALRYAMDGAGTDEEMVRNSLAGKSREQIAEIREQYRQQYGRDLDTELNGENSGRDGFEISQLMLGEPKTPQEVLARMNSAYDFERGSGAGLFGKAVTDAFSDSGEVLDMQHARLQELGARLERGEASQEDLDRLQTIAGYQTADVKNYQASRDAITNSAAIGATAVVGTAATLVTGGLAGPAVAASIGALAGGAAGMGMKYGMQGASYAQEDIATDAALALVSAASAGAVQSSTMTAGLRGMVGLTGNASASVGQTVAMEAVRGGSMGVVNGLAAGTVSENTWRGVGSGLENFLRTVTTSTVGGAASGAGTVGMAGAMGAAPKGVDPRQWGALTGGIGGLGGGVAQTAVDPAAWTGRWEDVAARFGQNAAINVFQGAVMGSSEAQRQMMRMQREIPVGPPRHIDDPNDAAVLGAAKDSDGPGNAPRTVDEHVGRARELEARGVTQPVTGEGDTFSPAGGEKFFTSKQDIERLLQRPSITELHDRALRPDMSGPLATEAGKRMAADLPDPPPGYIRTNNGALIRARSDGLAPDAKAWFAQRQLERAKLPPTDGMRNVVVDGGGPTGALAALQAFKLGHNVTIVEMRDQATLPVLWNNRPESTKILKLIDPVLADQMLSGDASSKINFLENVDQAGKVTVNHPNPTIDPDPQTATGDARTIASQVSSWQTQNKTEVNMYWNRLEQLAAADAVAATAEHRAARLHLMRGYEVTGLPVDGDRRGMTIQKVEQQLQKVTPDGKPELGPDHKPIQLPYTPGGEVPEGFKVVRGTSGVDINLGTPDDLLIAEGAGSKTRAMAGSRQVDVGPSAEYIAGYYEGAPLRSMPDADGNQLRGGSRIGMDTDRSGRPLHVVAGTAANSDGTWALPEVDPSLNFKDPKSIENYFGRPMSAKDATAAYYREKVGNLLHVDPAQIGKDGFELGPAPFRLQSHVSGPVANDASNVHLIGDARGNSHFLASLGKVTGTGTHQMALRSYWQALQSGFDPLLASALLDRRLDDGTRVWVKSGLPKFNDHAPTPATPGDADARMPAVARPLPPDFASDGVRKLELHQRILGEGRVDTRDQPRTVSVPRTAAELDHIDATMAATLGAKKWTELKTVNDRTAARRDALANDARLPPEGIHPDFAIAAKPLLKLAQGVKVSPADASASDAALAALIASSQTGASAMGEVFLNQFGVDPKQAPQSYAALTKKLGALPNSDAINAASHAIRSETAHADYGALDAQLAHHLQSLSPERLCCGRSGS